MTTPHADEIAANLERAQQSIRTARKLTADQYYDFAASRAYYAAFYAASAILLREGLDVSKHSGVIAAIHQRFVKTGRLDKEQGRSLNWLFGLRNVGDYGVTAHASRSRPKKPSWRQRLSWTPSKPSCRTNWIGWQTKRLLPTNIDPEFEPVHSFKMGSQASGPIRTGVK